MKKNILKAMSVFCAAGLMFGAAGCGTTTTTSEIIETVSGSGGTYVSGTSGTAGTSGTDGTTQQGGTSSGFDNAQGGASSLDTTTGGADLKGATVTIGKWDNGAEPAPSSSTYQQEMQLIADIEKKYNCKIEFYGTGGSMEYYNHMITSLSAGQAEADIMYLPGDMAFPSAALSGYFTELDGLVNLTDLQWNQSANSVFTLNGKHYFVSPSINTGSLAGTGVFFNKKMFSDANVKTPEQYVKENNWTWDTFREVAQKLTGNGKYGVASYSANNYGTSFFLTSNATQPVLNDGGKHILNLGTASAIAAINFSAELKNNGWITKGYDKFTGGTAAMLLAPYYESNDYTNALGGSNVGFTFLPLGPNANDYSDVYIGTSVEAIGIPVATKLDKNTLASIMADFTNRYTWRKTASQQLESYFADADSLSRAVQMAEYAYAKLDFQPYYGDTTDDIFWGDYGIDAGTSAQAYVQSIASKAQADIDAVWSGSN